MLAKGSQDTSCQNCKSLYNLLSRSILEEFFFQEHCLEYTPNPTPETEPEVVEPVEEEIVEETVEEENVQPETDPKTVEEVPEDNTKDEAKNELLENPELFTQPETTERFGPVKSNK